MNVNMFSSFSFCKGVLRRPVEEGDIVALPFMPPELRVATMAAVREFDRPIVEVDCS